jgi:hypothetical protein
MAETRKRNDSRRTGPSFVDEELAGKHGTTASERSLTEEKDPAHHPGNPSDVLRKVGEETAEEPSITGKAKRILHEADRQFSGEYERREDPDAVGAHGEPPQRKPAMTSHAKRQSTEDLKRAPDL